MKKRPSKHVHRAKLTALFISKIVFALLGFFIGLVIGTATDNIWLTIFIASVVAILFYLITVLHMIDRLNLG